MVTNIHYRDLNATVGEVGAILDSLSTAEDKLWPIERWPAIFIEKPIKIGSKGCHSIIKYEVECYDPGKLIRFKFLEPVGFVGTHEFSVESVTSGTTRLQHTVNMSLRGIAKIQWIVAIRWLHDALVEDALDKVESQFTEEEWKPRKLFFWTQLLKDIIRRKQLAKLEKTKKQGQ
ncbi:MAG: hypothetical protein CVU89_17500 [Firmicutes bacterium HGW-Firmicutes-14]|nr:MAG: hypothetical protein CVU89_17500 [Firmicutes bacterium HGW-Firmicutes-14]